MDACRWVRFGYRLLPLTAWRAWLLSRHMDRCPRCQSRALDDRGIRSLGVTPADLQEEPPLSPFAPASRVLPRRVAFHFRWSYAYGFVLAAAILWAVIAVSRVVPPGIEPQGTVTVAEASDEARVFAVLEARIGGEPARPVVFKPGKPGMTIVWFEKSTN